MTLFSLFAFDTTAGLGCDSTTFGFIGSSAMVALAFVGLSVAVASGILIV